MSAARRHRWPRRSPKFRIGANLAAFLYYSTVNPTPDLLVTGLGFDLPHGCQTTLAATHSSGDGFFKVTDTLFHGESGDFNFRRFPGAVISSLSALNCKDTAGGNVNSIIFTGNIVIGTGIILVSAITGGADATFTNGSILFSNNANAYRNPNYLTLTEYIDGGYSTGYPDGLGTNQVFNSQVGQNSILPAGTYTFIGDGTGRLSWASFLYADGSTHTAGSVSFTAGVPNNTLVLTQPIGINGITLTLDQSTAGNPLRNVSLVMPDRAGHVDNFVASYNAHRGIANKNYFLPHPSLLGLCASFPVVRLMDPMDTNNSTISSWASRPLPGWKLGNASAASGVPDEVLAQLCAGKTAWLNVKHPWNDADVTSQAQFWRDNFAGPVIVELSNEVWNGLFGQFIHGYVSGSQAFNPYLVTSLTYSSGTGKCTAVIPAHGFVTNDVIAFTGADATIAADGNYNGEHPVTVVDANTVTFTPTSAPTSATATARPYHSLLGLPTTSAQMKTVTSAVWTLTGSTANLTITSTAHGFTTGNQSIVLLNCTDEAFNVAFTIQSTTTNTITVKFDGQGHPHTLPVLTGLTATAVARAGMTMRICRISSNSAKSGAMLNAGNARDQWYGQRAAQVHKLWHDAFAATGALSRLSFVACYQAAGSLANIKVVMDQYVASLPGGVLYGDVKHYLGFAPYYGSAGQYDASFLGTVKTINAGNLTFAAGVCSVTLTAHGYSTNDVLTIFNTVDFAYTGRQTIVVDDADHFHYTPAATPGSSPAVVSNSSIGIICVKNNPYQLEYSGAVLSGGVVTMTSYNHGLANGTSIYLTGQRFPDWYVTSTGGAFVATVVDANTLSVVAPNSTALLATRGWLFPAQAVADLHASTETHRTVTVAGWLANYVAQLALYPGIRLACYECGQSNQIGVALNASAYPALSAQSGLYCAWNRSAAIRAQYLAYFRQLAAARIELANHYNLAGLAYSSAGSWALLEYMDANQAFSPKWLGALDAVAG